jgi:GH25 family lysozyme M1 (1,4-beta-N-acetylmuramidase)
MSLLHPLYFSAFPQGATVTPRAHGIDASKYDLFFHPEEATGQLDFVIQRISYRATRDEAFETLLPGVMSVPIRGGYHYLNSDTDWRRQADKYLSCIDGYDYHFHACDFEGAFNVLSTGFAYWAWLWIHYVQEKTGVPVLLYTSPSLYNQYIAPSQTKLGINWNTVPLWTAQWFFTPNPNGTPSNPVGRTSGWKFWQYTDKGNGPLYGVSRPTACDLNVFNGTVQELQEWLNVGAPPVVVIPPNDGGIMYRGTTATIAKVWNAIGGQQIAEIRAGETVRGNPPQGDYVFLLEPKVGWTKRLWLRDYAPEVVVPPPPPPDPEPTVTLKHTIQTYSDGTIRIDGNPYP